MTIVFLSGSRKIGRLNEEIRLRIDSMIEKRLGLVIGDANGADKAMQAYLAESDYRDVTVYFVGDAPRNNIGRWPEKHVLAHESLSGRDYYAQKDKHMSTLADFGFILWNGQSAGSVQNMLWLLSDKKKVVVYLSPQGRFYNVKTQDELIEMLLMCDEETLDDLGKKVALPDRLQRANRRQTSLSL